ncbi:uncharacterized protein L201_000300 [Kwoniella dendrophila CBS 6074]|uniref:Mitochondrial protein n=1 Tax=Kwoniella dendrophila CBS 6074 TaxID=1295534 RepID=A0AAX4JKW7_9TREE
MSTKSSLLKNIPSLSKLKQKSILEISGPDSTKFLKGLSCKDVDLLKGGYSGFLNASGRVLHTSFIFPTTKLMKNGKQEKSYLITHESSSSSDHPNPLEDFLVPFKLRAKVRIKDVTNEYDNYSCYATEDLYSKGKGKEPIRNWKFGSGGAAESQWSWLNNEPRNLELKDNEVGCWDLRAGWSKSGLGRQVLVPKGEKPSLASSHDLVSTEDYHLRRMLLGVPDGPNEIIPGSALPLESCMDLHGGVDFRKGCYLGQELTVRTYHTGATRKRILSIRLIPLNKGNTLLSEYLATPLDTASSTSGISNEQLEITYIPSSTSASKKSRSAGKILSLHNNSSDVNSIGLGLIRIEFAERSCWSSSSPLMKEGLTIKDWYENDEISKLTTKIGDQIYGVYVDKGEAFSEALKVLENKD